jgi:hypothetical protein
MHRLGGRSLRQTSEIIGELRATLAILLAVAGALLGRRAAVTFARDVASALGGFQTDHAVLWAGGDLALMTLRQRRS